MNNLNYPNDFVNKVICGNCINIMQQIPDESIDLVITSPPYDNLRDYKGYNFNFNKVANELFRIIKNGGTVVWIVGDKIKDKSETLIPFKQALYFKEIGFFVHDTMIYQKNAMPFPEQTRYIQCFEYMFIFTKGKPKTTNLIKEKTKGYKPSKSSAQRNQDGTTSKLKYKQGKKYRNLWNIWLYEVGYNKTTKDKFAYEHPAMFPEKLAEDHILSWSNKGDLVLDPMCGSGTTCKMTKLNGRRFIGIDISEEYCKITRKRLNQVNNLESFIK